MREGCATSTDQKGANKCPKTENEELAREEGVHQRHDRGVNLLRSVLSRGDEEKDQDTPSIQFLNLNLSLTTPQQSNSGLHLNIESPDEYHNQ